MSKRKNGHRTKVRKNKANRESRLHKQWREERARQDAEAEQEKLRSLGIRTPREED